MSRISDHFNLISKLDRVKLGNSYDLITSYLISRYRKIASHKGMPLSISIEPTTSCNLRCPECPSGLRSFTRPTGMLESSLFNNIVEELYPYLAYLIFYFQGEPYLHPQFLQMVSLASEKNIYTATSTNGHFLDDKNSEETVRSGLDRLIISIDGTTQETYESYRIGGSLEKVIEGVRNIVCWKQKLRSKTPHLIFQFLVVRPNEHQVNDVKILAESLGVDEVRYKTAQIYDYELGSDLIPVNRKFSRYELNGDGRYVIRNALHNNCWKMWHSAVITWDGKVVPCCFDKDASHPMGDLQNNSFRELWSGQAYRDFRSLLLQSRNKVEMCRNCTEGTKVWV